MIRMEVRSRCEDGDSKGKVWKDAPHLELKYSVNGGEAAVHSCVVVSVLVYGFKAVIHFSALGVDMPLSKI